MMLQFIILMPIFWAISRYVKQNVKRGIEVAIATFILPGYISTIITSSTACTSMIGTCSTVSLSHSLSMVFMAYWPGSLGIITIDSLLDFGG